MKYRTNFAELVEAVASFQYQTEYLIETLDGYIKEAESFKNVNESDRHALLKTLYELKPIVIQSLACKTIIRSLKL